MDPEARGIRDTASISRGVFAFRKGRREEASRDDDDDVKAASKSRKRPRGKAPVIRQPAKGSKKDVDPYHVIVTKAEEAFARMQKSLFGDVLSAVTDFVGKWGKEMDECSHVIPTCALLTGVNLPDHEDLFKLVAREISDTVSPHVASLRAGSNAPTHRALIQSAVGQLMMLDESEQEIKRSNLVLPALEAWYHNQYLPRNRQVGSPRKKRARLEVPEGDQEECRRKPLIIILEDFESFPSALLQDFILNLIESAKTLPIVLVFGVATVVSVVHQKLPHHVSSFLAIEKFSGQKATELLSKLVEKVLMNEEIPFKLGGKTLEMLLEIFLFSDFSVRRFLAGYKYCLFEHFHGAHCEIAEAVCISSKYQRTANVRSFTRKQLDLIRSLRSFRNFVEESPKTRAKLLLCDNEFRTHLEQAMEQIDLTTITFNAAVKSLFILTRDLPKSPFGKQIFSVYRSALSKDVTENHEYRDAFTYLGHSTYDTLKRKLESILNCIDTKGVSQEFALLCKRGEDLMKNLNNLMDSPIKSSVISPAKKYSTASPSTPKTPKLTRQELQQKLLEKTKEQRKNQSPFECLRKECLEWLHCLFKVGLVPPSRLPFHELVYFDKASTLRRHLMAFPRGVIKTALEDPIIYLEQADLDISSPNEIPASFPDTAIAFKLHGEAGKLINLYDWLQSWLSIVDDEGGVNSDDEDNVNPLYHARFTQAVSALQFLGFVKPSKRKTDHMAKLTWGE